MRRRRLARGCTPSVGPQLTDENGQPITFATPGAPTLEERRRYAQAVRRATTPTPLTREQEAAREAEMRRRRELLQELGVYVED